MPKTLFNWLLVAISVLVLLLVALGSHAQPYKAAYKFPPAVVAKPRLVAPLPQPVAVVLAYSGSLLYVREKTGNNDGPPIDGWADATGTARRSSWCGLYQWAVNTHCGHPVPNGPAGSYNWFKDVKRTFYIENQRGSLDAIALADKVGFYYKNLGRIGHIGMVVAIGRGTRKGRTARGYTIRAGNTGTGGGRDGAGVRDYFYLSSDIHAASRW